MPPQYTTCLDCGSDEPSACSVSAIVNDLYAVVCRGMVVLFVEEVMGRPRAGFCGGVKKTIELRRMAGQISASSGHGSSLIRHHAMSSSKAVRTLKWFCFPH